MRLNNERHAVIRAENPVRLLRGLEPRYSYWVSGNSQGRLEQTINIVTGKIKAGKLTVSIYDIEALIPQTHQDALK